jgi:NADH-quinone oxidoreductase subunit L
LQPLTSAIEAKFMVDEIYQAAIIEPLRDLGRFFFAIDRIVVDGIVWLIGFVPQLSGFVLKLSVQRGYLQGYAAAMFFGIVAILLIVFL